MSHAASEVVAILEGTPYGDGIAILKEFNLKDGERIELMPASDLESCQQKYQDVTEKYGSLAVKYCDICDRYAHEMDRRRAVQADAERRLELLRQVDKRSKKFSFTDSMETTALRAKISLEVHGATGGRVR